MERSELDEEGLTVVIEGETFVMQQPVFDLMLMISKERDHYRDIVHQLDDYGTQPIN